MNKKGFTLVELLAVVILIGVLGAIAVVSYTSVVKKSEKRAFELYEETMYTDAMTLLTKDSSYIPANGGTSHLTLTMLKTGPITNPRNPSDLCPNSYVDVTRNDYNVTDSNGNTTHVDSFTYTVCLKCEQSNYNVDGSSCVVFPKATPSS